MPLIGSRKHAAEIRDLHHNGFVQDAHPDWEKVGSGGFRSVYLHKPSGVCYKVGHADWSSAHENPCEVRNARSLLRKCINNDQWINAYVRIPKVSGFSFVDEVIVAMEFIVGTLGRNADTPEEARQALFSLKFGDMHAENYIVDEAGTIWPVDMASPRPGSPNYSGPDHRALHNRRMW